MYDTSYFFWNDRSEPQTIITDVSRAPKQVFGLSEVNDAHGHRFRHTLVTEILGSGGSMGPLAYVLGISEHVARKHVAKWSLERQEQVWKIMAEIQRERPAKPKKSVTLTLHELFGRVH